MDGASFERTQRAAPAKTGATFPYDALEEQGSRLVERGKGIWIFSVALPQLCLVSVQVQASETFDRSGDLAPPRFVIRLLTCPVKAFELAGNELVHSRGSRFRQVLDPIQIVFFCNGLAWESCRQDKENR
jgi:hypothetical protein